MKRFLMAVMILLVAEWAGAFPAQKPAQWRWRNDDGGIVSATWKDSVNQPIVYRGEEKLRLRKTLVAYNGDLITLRYGTDPFFESTWIPITAADTGKFSLAASEFLDDCRFYGDNQMLPALDSEQGVYRGTITIDLSSAYFLTNGGPNAYELEYCLKANRTILPGAFYYFTSFRNGYFDNDIYNLPCIRFPPVYWQYYHTRGWEPKAIHFADEVNGWLQSMEGIETRLSRTADGGKTWTVLPGDWPGPLFVFDKKTLWAANEKVLYQSTDGGESWQPRFEDPLGQSITSVYFCDSLHGWAGLNVTGLAKTADGGATWEDIIIPYVGIFELFFLNDQTGFALGRDANIPGTGLYKSIDGGKWWRRLSPLNEGVNGSNIQFVDASNGWMIVDGKIVHTGDGGVTWQEATYPRSGAQAVNALKFTDREHGWAIGYRGLILATRDGGATWEERPSATVYDLKQIAAVGEHVWIASATDGTVLTSASGGWTTMVDTTKKDVTLPRDCSLYQNYPNPFNPSTTIRYALPKASHVALRIYDILGREVLTLVDEVKQAGAHEAVWNASRYSSGVYICRMQAGGYQQARMMALVK